MDGGGNGGGLMKYNIAGFMSIMLAICHNPAEVNPMMLFEILNLGLIVFGFPQT